MKLKERIKEIDQWTTAALIYIILCYCAGAVGFLLGRLLRELLTTPEFRKHPVTFLKKIIHDVSTKEVLN